MNPAPAPHTCATCRPLLGAFAARTLAPGERRRVGAHLAVCPRCEAAYQAQKRVLYDLEHTLPAVGRAERPRLAGLWLAVQGEMRRPRRTTADPRRMSASAAVLALALMLTFSLGDGRLRAVLPTPPTPATDAAVATEDAGRTHEAAAGLETPSADADTRALASATPEAEARPARYAIADGAAVNAATVGAAVNAATVTPPALPRYAPTAQPTTPQAAVRTAPTDNP
jgi:hypothetical protein